MYNHVHKNSIHNQQGVFKKECTKYITTSRKHNAMNVKNTAHNFQNKHSSNYYTYINVSLNLTTVFKVRLFLI